MAGTTSATRRQSYVSTAMPAAGLKRFLGMLHALGKGDTTRGVIVFTALALSLAGVVAPHIDANLLAALFSLEQTVDEVLTAGPPRFGPAAFSQCGRPIDVSRDQHRMPE